jgi:hypothetical protein
MEVVTMTRSKSGRTGTFNCPVEIPVEVLGGKWKLVLGVPPTERPAEEC